MKKQLLTFVCVICCVLIGTLVARAQNFRNQSDLQWIAVPDENDWTYVLGNDARVSLQLLWHGMPLENTQISYSVGGDCLDADTQGRVKTDAKGNAEIRIKSPKKAGFRDCQMSCKVENLRFENHIKLGWSPEKLTAFTQMPKDFEAFWKQVLTEQEMASKLKPIVLPQNSPMKR